MKHIINLLTVLSLSLLACSCEKQIDKSVVWPEWASRPIVENAELKGIDGKVAVVAGDKVVYTANVHDDYNDLTQLEMTVAYGGKTALSIVRQLSGASADLSVEFPMPFAAMLTDGMVPELTLTVTNKANGKVIKRLDNDHNVVVSRPELPQTLYIVDNLGQSFEMDKEGDFDYSVDDETDLSGLGDSFFIATAINGGKPDFSGIVWGSDGNGIVAVSDGGSPIPTPDSEGYGFKNISFNSFSFELDALVDYVVVVDAAEMEAQEQSGVSYLVSAGRNLIRNCEVVFEGFGDLSEMLQSDRFDIIGEKSAKFTGHSRKWTFFYDVDDNWMILNYVNFNEAGQVWFTGKEACFPLGDETSEHVFNYLSADGKDRYGTLAGVTDENGVYRCDVFLMEGFHIQLYSWVKWSTVISMVSLNNAYGEITDDGLYIRQGSEFTPGVYTITVKLTKAPDAGGDGAEADIELIPCF